MKCLLFQGDSITHSFRLDEYYKPIDCPLLGPGYVFLIAAALGRRYPRAGFRILNRGIGGNGVDDVNARWKRDCLDLQPAMLSILLGVNDANPSRQPEQSPEQFEAGYRELLLSARAQNPAVQLILLEPFGLKLPAGEHSFPVMSDDWRTRLFPRQRIVRQLASEFDGSFVSLQSIFDAATVEAAAEHWAIDGIHPSAAGNQLIADAWLTACAAIGVTP
jgi:lysophospholipase L1-like esterase